MNILIAGDFVPDHRIKSLCDKEKYDFFTVIKDLNEKVDYAIVNFESPVVLHPCKPIKKTGPNLKCDEKAVKAIKYAGFNCVTLASNHFYDYGEVGVRDTLKTCQDNGIDTVGGGIDLFDAAKIHYKKIDNRTLAIINCCEHEWSIATLVKGGSAPLGEVDIYYKIKEARSKADFVIVITHGGTQDYNLPTPRMKKTYQFFIDVGADAVVNHHQHCYSGYEEYKGKFIFYGIGNFCFDNGIRKLSPWNKGYLVLLKFSDSYGFEIIPYVQCAGNPTIELYANVTSFYDDIKRLNALIVDDKQISKSFDLMVKKKEKYILSLLQPYENKYLRALYIRGLLPSFFSLSWYRCLLAHFRCESHNDIMLRILENKLK